MRSPRRPARTTWWNVGATPSFDGQAVVERLRSDQTEQPVLLVIDDLHELRSTEALRLLERFLTALPPEPESCWPRARSPSWGCIGCG